MVQTIHFPLEGQRKNGKVINMKIQLVKNVKSERGVGRKATEPRIRVSENGQVSFNALAMEPFTGVLYGYAGVSSDKSGTIVQINPAPKLTENTKFPVKFQGDTWEESDFIKINHAGKKGTFCSLAGLLRANTDYDFKQSGGQTFAAELADGGVQFTLPHGVLTPAPKQARKRAKTADAAASATVSSAPSEDEMSL